LFNALSDDLEDECRKMDAIIHEKGGIDLMVVGIGLNGHIGFNEPGVSNDLYSHVIELDDKTQSVGQKYFKEAVALKQGITLGLNHLMESETVILIANGFKKADIIQMTIQNKISNKIPATIIREHPNSFLMIDREAAAKISDN
jgi:6-phosphogluconolactonase/glucosamine-6-phosphate isomerase/deaminase